MVRETRRPRGSLDPELFPPDHPLVGQTIHLVGEGSLEGEREEVVIARVRRWWLTVQYADRSVERFRLKDGRKVGTMPALYKYDYTFVHVSFKDLQTIVAPALR